MVRTWDERHKGARWTGYAFALASVLIAVLIRWLLLPILGGDFDFLTLYGAVAVAVWYGGWKPALAAAVGFLLADLLFIAATGGLGFDTALVWASLAGYVLSCRFIIYFGEATRRAREAAQCSGV